MLVGIQAIVPLGIDDGDGRRERRTWLVVIRDDQVETDFSRAGRGFHTADTAVHRDAQLDAVSMEPVYCCRLQAVSITQTLGDEVAYVATEEFERPAKNDRRRDAIDVVVTVDGDAFAIGQRARDANDSFRKAGQLRRRMKMIDRGPQEPRGSIRIGETAA